MKPPLPPEMQSGATCKCLCSHVCCPVGAGGASSQWVCETRPDGPPSSPALALAMSRERGVAERSVDGGTAWPTPAGRSGVHRSPGTMSASWKCPITHSPCPSGSGQAALRAPHGPASMGQARIPMRPPWHLCTAHTASAPDDTSLTASLLRGQVTRDKPSGPALRFLEVMSTLSITPSGEGGQLPCTGFPPAKERIYRTILPDPTSPQQPQLLHNDSFCKPHVQGMQ